MIKVAAAEAPDAFSACPGRRVLFRLETLSPDGEGVSVIVGEEEDEGGGGVLLLRRPLFLLHLRISSRRLLPLLLPPLLLLQLLPLTPRLDEAAWLTTLGPS